MTWIEWQLFRDTFTHTKSGCALWLKLKLKMLLHCVNTWKQSVFCKYARFPECRVH